MNPLELKRQQLSQLTDRQRIAFMATCCDRMLSEVSKCLRELPTMYSPLSEATDAVWRWLENPTDESNRNWAALHRRASEVCELAEPTSGGCGPAPDPLADSCASATTLLLASIANPSRSAELAAPVSFHLFHLLNFIYAAPNDVTAEEEQWQRRVVEAVQWQDHRRQLQEQIPDYTRSGYSNDFFDRYLAE